MYIKIVVLSNIELHVPMSSWNLKFLKEIFLETLQLIDTNARYGEFILGILCNIHVHGIQSNCPRKNQRM